MNERSPRLRATLILSALSAAALNAGIAWSAQDGFNAKPFASYQNDDSLSAKHYEDMQKITRVLKQYVVAIDTLNEDLFGSVFTDDAVFEIREVTHHGRAEIITEVSDDKAKYVEQVAKAAAKGAPKPNPRNTFHMMTNSHVVFTDQTHALHNSYYMVWVRENPSPGGVVRLTTPITMVAIGRYDDELIKVNGKWLIKRRRVTPDTNGGF